MRPGRIGSWSKDTLKYIRDNKLDKLIDVSPTRPKKGIIECVDPGNTRLIPPEWDDLVRLHRLVRARKVSTILEFGVGQSTVILADALKRNEDEYGDYWKSILRRQNLFELHCIDPRQDFIDAAIRSLGEGLKKRVHCLRADVLMAEFNGRICTLFERLPNICPDLIYLDGPDQFCPVNQVRGITTAHQDRLPMSADLLTIEHFLLPGTLIVVDGRTANARFLKCNLQRSWVYKWVPEDDVHYFELMEQPLGRLNRAQVDFCLGKAWLKRQAIQV